MHWLLALTKAWADSNVRRSRPVKQPWGGPPASWGYGSPGPERTYAPKIVREHQDWPYQKWPGQ